MKCDEIISHNWHPIMGDASNIEEKWDQNEETRNKDRKNGLKVGKMKKRTCMPQGGGTPLNIRASGREYIPKGRPSDLK